MELTRDEGPLERFEALKRDDGAPGEVFRLLTDDEPLTLREIAKLWRVPKGRFMEWFTSEQAPLYDLALKVRAADLALEAMQAALEATPQDVAVRKLQADVALKLAAKFDRARYGESVRHETAVTVGVDAGLLGAASDLLALAASRLAPEKVIAGAVVGAALDAPSAPTLPRPLAEELI